MKAMDYVSIYSSIVSKSNIKKKSEKERESSNFFAELRVSRLFTHQLHNLKLKYK